MSKHIQYGKTFGLFYDAYRKFCKENSPDGKPNSETPEMFRQWFISNFVSKYELLLINIYIFNYAFFVIRKEKNIKQSSSRRRYSIQNAI